MTSQRVKEILNFCPATMGSGLHSSDADDRRRLRASAVAKLKALLEKIKANIKDPDRALCEDLQHVAELRPKVFREPELLEAVCELLTGRGAKTAIQSSSSHGHKEEPRVAQATACAILTSALKALPEWPLALLDVYMHDALGSRQWISHSRCKLLVDNLRGAWDPGSVPRPPKMQAVVTAVASGDQSRRRPATSSPGTPPDSKRPRTSPESGDGSESSSGDEEVEQGGAVGDARPTSLGVSSASKTATSGRGRDAGGDSDAESDSSGDEVVEEGGTVGSVVTAPPQRAVKSAAVAAAAQKAAAEMQALVRKREEEARTFSGFEKINREGEDANLPEVLNRFYRNKEAAKEVIMSALLDRFGTSSMGGKVPTRPTRAWSAPEKKTEWQVVLAVTELSTLPSVRSFVAPHLNRWLNSPAFKDMASDLLHVLVKRVDPVDGGKDDDTLLEAILTINTDKPSLKPLYSSALLGLLRQHPEFSPKVLESTLLPLENPGGVGGTGGGRDAGGSGAGGTGDGGSGSGPGSAESNAARQMAVTERTRTVLSSLFDALGQRRGMVELARVLASLTARAAASSVVMAEAAAKKAEETAETAAAPLWESGLGSHAAAQEAAVAAATAATVAATAASASSATSPRALLPVLESLRVKNLSVVGLAVEVLEIGRVAADALTRAGASERGDETLTAGGLGGAFGGSDPSGRDLAYLQGMNGKALRRWAVALSTIVRDMVMWRARRECVEIRSSERKRLAIEAESLASGGPSRKRKTAFDGAGGNRAVAGTSTSKAILAAMNHIRTKFLKEMAQLHHSGLVWCERAAPSLLMVGEDRNRGRDRDRSRGRGLYGDSRDGGKHSLWKDCLVIIRRLALLSHRSGGVGGSGGAGGPNQAEGQAEDSIGTDAELLCDTTAVLDGEGIRSVLKLVAVPVNAPPQELLSLLETLVLRAARSRAAYKNTAFSNSGPNNVSLGGNSSSGGGTGASAAGIPPKKMRVNPSPSAHSPPPRAWPNASEAGGGGARSGSLGPSGQAHGSGPGSGSQGDGVPVGPGRSRLGSTGGGPLAQGGGSSGTTSVVHILLVKNTDVEMGLLQELFQLSSHKVKKSAIKVIATKNAVSNANEARDSRARDERDGNGGTGSGDSRGGGAGGGGFGKHGSNRSGSKSSGKFGGHGGARATAVGGWFDNMLSRGQMALTNFHSGGGSGSGSSGSGGGRAAGEGGGSKDRRTGNQDGRGNGVGSVGVGDVSVPSPPKLLLRLAHAKLFWRSAVVALVLAATNPGTIGRHLWETSPTMRCLMQMLVCTDFRFPPPGGSSASLGEQPTAGTDTANKGSGDDGKARESDASSTTASVSSPRSSSHKELGLQRNAGAGSSDRRRGYRGEEDGETDRDREELAGEGGSAGVTSSSTGGMFGGGAEAMVAADERVRKEEREAMDQIYARRPRRHRRPPPPPPPKRSPAPHQVSKRGRILRTTKQKNVTYTYSSEDEEEESPKHEDDQVSDPEDFPPGNPEIRYDEFIKLDISMPARRPPDDVLRRIEELDREMKLGAELRRCTHPDFITQVVAGRDPERVGRESVERSASWLVSAIAAEPEALLRRLPLAVIVHLLLLACYNAYEEDQARQAKEVVSASSSAVTPAEGGSGASTSASSAPPMPTNSSAGSASISPTTPGMPNRRGHPQRSEPSSSAAAPASSSSSSSSASSSSSSSMSIRQGGAPGAPVSASGSNHSTTGPGSSSVPPSAGGGARGVGWAGLFDGMPPRVAGHRRETPRLRWLALALRDSVAERVWSSSSRSSPSGDRSNHAGGAASEAMSLLLQDLAHAYKGRRAAARRALQSVLSSPPPSRRRSNAGAETSNRPSRVVAWRPTNLEDDLGGGQEEESEKTGAGEGSLVVTQTEADEEQCGWLFLCRDLPAWSDVAPLVVRAVHDSVFYETASEPIRYSLLSLDIVTRPGRRLSLKATDGDDASAAAGAGVASVAREDQWFFTFLLCRFLSGRKMVASNTLQRYPETFDLAASAVNTAIKAATVEGVDLFAEGSVWASHTKTRFPCLDSATDEVREVPLPLLLLETAIALLSFHRADASPPPELKELQELMFPAENSHDALSPSPSTSTGTVLGVGAAVSEDGGAALGVKLWVRLAQAPSQQMSALAARCTVIDGEATPVWRSLIPLVEIFADLSEGDPAVCRYIPKMLLPRLLMASGLSKSSVSVTLSRLDALGTSDSNAGLFYQDLLSPESQGKWEIGTKPVPVRTMKNNLLRRVRAYLYSSNDYPGSGGDTSSKQEGQRSKALGVDNEAEAKKNGMFLTWLAEHPSGQGSGSNADKSAAKAAATAATQERHQRETWERFTLTDEKDPAPKVPAKLDTTLRVEDGEPGSPDRKAAARAASDVTGVEREGTKKVDGDGSGVDADAGGEGKVTEDEDAKDLRRRVYRCLDSERARSDSDIREVPLGSAIAAGSGQQSGVEAASGVAESSEVLEMPEEGAGGAQAPADAGGKEEGLEWLRRVLIDTLEPSSGTETSKEGTSRETDMVVQVLGAITSWQKRRTAELFGDEMRALLVGCRASDHILEGRVPLKMNDVTPRPANGGTYAPPQKVAAAEAEARGEQEGSGLGWIPTSRPPPGSESQSLPNAASAVKYRAGRATHGRGLDKTALALRSQAAARVAEEIEEVFRRAKLVVLEVFMAQAARRPQARGSQEREEIKTKEELLTSTGTRVPLPSRSHCALQEMLEFLGGSPEDEWLWNGLLSSSDALHEFLTDKEGESSGHPWQTRLLHGMLLGCTPSVIEKRLRPAMKSIADGASIGVRRGDAEVGDDDVTNAKSVKSAKSAKSAKRRDTAASAAMVLRGFYQLAMDPRVMPAGPKVGEAGSADNLEVWARRYFARGAGTGRRRGTKDYQSSLECYRKRLSWLSFSPSEVTRLVKLILLATVDDRGPLNGGKASRTSSRVPGDWSRLLLGACSEKPRNLEAAVKWLLQARGGVDAEYDDAECDDAVPARQEVTEETMNDVTSNGPSADDESDGFGVAVELENDEVVVEKVKVEEQELEDDEEEEEAFLKDESDVNDGSSVAASADDAPSEGRHDDDGGHDDGGHDDGDGDDGDEGGDNNDNDKDEDTEVGRDDREESGREEVSSSAAPADGAAVRDTDQGKGSKIGEEADKGSQGVDTAVDDTRQRRREEAAIAAVADELLYELYMADPTAFQECLESEKRRGEALAFLVKQFVRCGPAVPFATGARGPGFYATVAARSLAGVGLIIGERAVARRRLKVVVAEHTALLAEVAKHHPLIFLEQVPALTEVLLNDAEVNRSAASVEEPSLQAGIGSTTPLIGMQNICNQERDTVASAMSFRSRRVSPTRLCPFPAVLRSERAYSEGRAANAPGKTILVHVRFWGQHYTDAVWGGVLEALRAAPRVLLSGEAGSVAGVPKLLETYLGLVAVQLMVDHGPEVAPLAGSLRTLLDDLGDLGESILSTTPPAGNGTWESSKKMLASVPPVTDSPYVKIEG